MRTTTHHSRGKAGSRKAYGTRHNDRDFDLEAANHIDPTLTPNNKEWHLYHDVAPELTFTEAELRFYEANFAGQLEEINQNYLKNRHPERCKDMAAWKSTKQNAPEESLFQIGDMHETGQYADAKTLMACYNDFLRYERQWNRDHGNPFTILNQALHVDEPGCPPHIQVRKVWHYKTDSGELRIGQERALEMAGVELPAPTQKPGRYNHRKMTYDAMMREKWLDILQEHGIQIEREPLPSGKGKKSKDKEQYLRDKFKSMEKEVAQARQKADAAEARAEEAEAKVKAAEQRAQELETAMDEQTAVYNKLLQTNAANAAIIQEQEQALGLIQDYEEYCYVADIAEEDLDTGERMIRMLPPPKGLFRPADEKEWLLGMKNLLLKLLQSISECIRRLQIFEVRTGLEERRSEPAQKRATALSDLIADAFARVEDTPAGGQTKEKDEPSR